MKRLSGLFRSKARASGPVAPVDDALLADLEAKAEAAELGFRWVPLNRAGDLCYRADDRGRALSYYGRAIDAMLEDGQPEPARGLATKIVRIHPAAVRTLCTLTWLDLASHHMASVVVHLNEYVANARASGRHDLAGEQIHLMARVVADADFRCAAIDALDALECGDEAAEVKDWVLAGHAPHDHMAPEDWTDLCLSHALGSNVSKLDRERGEEGSEGESEEGSGEASEEGSEEVQAQMDSTSSGEDPPEEYRA